MFRRSEGEHRRNHQLIHPKEVRMKEGSGSEVTVVGQGAHLEGTVVSAGSLRVDGRVKGEINAEGDVVLTSNSQVEADIRAENVTVAGTFKGTIVARGRTDLAQGGRVDGNITSKTLVVAEGAFFSGQSIMDQQREASGASQRPSGGAAQEPSQAGEGRGSTVPRDGEVPARADAEKARTG